MGDTSMKYPIPGGIGKYITYTPEAHVRGTSFFNP